MSSPISTPKGGGAVSGLGEKFSPDLFTGTGNFSVPIALPPGRNGFQPELGLQYSTGSGNSPFGLGWNLSVPGVMRKTAKGVPLYDEEKDTFILSGAEDLLAVKKITIRYTTDGDNTVTNNAAGIAPLVNESGIITQYRPRTEGLFARIYHLKTNLRNCWKVLSKNGLTSWYGSKELFAGDLSLVQNPDNANSIFAWKLTRTEDTFGNHILYFYQKDAVRQSDYHRWDQNYLSEVKYADYSLTPFSGTGTAYMCRVLFNYETRTDAFSDYKAGFDIRTVQRCKDIQIFTNPIEGEIKTRTYHFQYSDETLPVDERPYNGVALLCKVEVEGHDDANADPNQRSEFLPPLEFRYTHFKPKQQKFKRIEGEQMPLESLANPGFELIDLFGNGLPDIVQVNGVVRYWRNMGEGKFDAPRLMKDAPTGFNLGDPDVQLVDANGDGRTDLLVNGTNMSGYFSMKHNASWDTKAFKKYKVAPSFSFADPEVKLLDLTGDGITDVLRNGASLECFFQDKNDGWVQTKRVPKKNIDGFAGLSFADPRIKLADMSGDGLQDIVQVYSGSVKYWPNLGYGNFGQPVVMKNSPRFDYPFNPTRLQLADIDGDGVADLIYIDAQKITFWINQNGNGWSEPFTIDGTPFVSNTAGVRIADIYGSGTAGVLYSFDAQTNTQQHRWYFLDLTGGTKPYLLHEMDNSMGALTRTSYLPSTRYYLAHQYGTNPFLTGSKREFKKRSPWKTTLPFPVQVVSRVEVIDQLSKGKLTTEYVYHHGYWDGGEREFRGFGRVDQRDTETFERVGPVQKLPEGEGLNSRALSSSFVGKGKFEDWQYSEDRGLFQVSPTGGDLEGAMLLEHYSPPVETRNWFHLGPIGDEFGDWMEVDFTEEYFTDDPSVLQKEIETFNLLQTLPRRAKRDALRAWRGSSLRSELYALDEVDPITKEYIPGAGGRPYTVSESQYGIRLEAAPVGSVPPLGGQGAAVLSPFGGGVGGGLPFEVLVIPKETSGYIFFSFATGSRTTQWERGFDPMTQFSFTTGFDAYGQPCKQLSAALPRGILPPYTSGLGTSPADEGNVILSKASVTTYAQKNNEETFIVDRTCKAISYEIIQQDEEDVFKLKKRVFAASLPVEVDDLIYPILGFSVSYYDADDAFGNGLTPIGTLGKHGAPALTETLVLTESNIEAAYDTTPVFFSNPDDDLVAGDIEDAGYPAAFEANLQNGDMRLGYRWRKPATYPGYATGWYAQSGRTHYDWQDGGNGYGLVLESKDAFDATVSIEYDNYKLLPVAAKQYLTAAPGGDSGSGDYLQTSAEYDYRIMQAGMITDPNGNRAVFGFSALGLLKQSGVIGKDTINLPYVGYAAEGDLVEESMVNGKRQITYIPSVRMEYDFFAFKPTDPLIPAGPVWVKTIQREKHYRKDDHTVETDDSEIIKVDFTDGFGRLLQTRAQAEDVLFTDSGLPEIQGTNGPAIGIERTTGPLNVVVSGYKIYNNKGKVVEQYEPYFDTGFDHIIQTGGVGEKIRMYYDPRGNVIRTLNPDGSQQWVIHGKPATPLSGAEVLSAVEVQNNWSLTGYTPTPWESYTYDANDLGYKTHPHLTAISTHWHTPANSTVDALGRAVKTITRLNDNATGEVVMRYQYDIQSNLLTTTDALNRIVFRHKYDIGKQLLFKQHLDSGISKAIADVAGKPIEASDARDAQVLNSYDAVSRPKNLWAKDTGAEDMTLRQVSVYAESLGLSTAADLNLLGQIYKQYDEAGLNQVESCDFKGNPIEKFKKIISDDELLDASPNAYTVDWAGLDISILDSTEYRTTVEYDALNRGIKLTLPDDIDSHRAVIEPVYNRAGALQAIKIDGTVYVKYITYNAKGQQLLAAWGNEIMMRFTYDKKSFRLKRVKAEKYEIGSSNEYQYNPLSGNSRYDQLYTYDLTGNIIQVNDATPDCGITGSTNILERVFEYDALYRLIYANGREMDTQGEGYLFADAPEIGNPTASNCRYYEQEYEYDKAGNIQKQRHRVIGDTSLYYTRKFVYNPSNNQHSEINNNQSSPTIYGSFTYDACGNMLTTNADRNYAWNYANQLKSYTLMSGSTVNTFAHYLYSGGHRIKKLVIKDNGDYESVTYIDGVFEYHQKVTTSTTEEKNYLLLQGNVEVRIGGYTGEDGETTLYTISDYLSSAAIRIKGDGTLYDKEEYYPYGDSSLKTYGKKRYRFTGKEKDNESGLCYYGARYYANWCMKFLSVDPKSGEFAHQSSYCYADCNPVVKNDPSGMEGEDPPNNTTQEITCNPEMTQSSVDNTATPKPVNITPSSQGSVDNTVKSEVASTAPPSQSNNQELPPIKDDSKFNTQLKSDHSAKEQSDLKIKVQNQDIRRDIDAKEVQPLTEMAISRIHLDAQKNVESNKGFPTAEKIKAEEARLTAFAMKGEAESFAETVLLCRYQRNKISFVGNAITMIKNDPDFKKFEKIAVHYLQAGKTKVEGGLTLGGERGSFLALLNEWDDSGDETLKVIANQLTWMLRHCDITATSTFIDGKLIVNYEIKDKLNLDRHEGQIGYNLIAEPLGAMWGDGWQYSFPSTRTQFSIKY